ncbi:MAG: DegV family protein, partial [Candidatus Onthovivens sp.]|nr:DegV family protein [Candidatus Onthovivens sp.]
QKCSDPSIIFISHGSCYSDAEYVKNKIIDNYPNINDVVIGDIGPVIGAHSGPGTVAIFFIGEER